MMIFFRPALLACAATLLARADAGAQEAGVPAAVPGAAAAAPPSAWSFNVTLASQYISRGFSNSRGKPVLQGGVDYVHPGGFNAGFWMSTLSDQFVQGSWAETDWYVGYTRAFGELHLGAQVYYYVYPGGRFVYDGSVRGQRYDYGELVPTLGYRWLTVKYWYTYTKDYFGSNDATLFTTGRGHSRGSGYLDVNVNRDLVDGLSLQLHYGHQKVAHFERIDWSDAKIGVTKSLPAGWSAALAATKAWSRRTDDFYGAGYTFDWTRYAVSPALRPFDPIKTTVVLSATKVF